MRFVAHVKEVRAKSLTQSGQLRRVIATRWGINERTLSLYYKCIFVPILTYGAPCWYGAVSNPVVAKVLISAQRQYLLLQTRACRTVSSVAFQVLADVVPADLQVLQSGFTYLIKRGCEVSWGDLWIREPGAGLEPAERKKVIRRNIIPMRNELIGFWQ